MANRDPPIYTALISTVTVSFNRKNDEKPRGFLNGLPEFSIPPLYLRATLDAGGARLSGSPVGLRLNASFRGGKAPLIRERCG